MKIVYQCKVCKSVQETADGVLAHATYASHPTSHDMWEEAQKVTVDLKVDIVTSPDDGLIVLADALLGDVDRYLENIHHVTVLKGNAKVNGRAIYDKDGRLR